MKKNFNIENIKNNFYNIKNIIDKLHVLSVEKKNTEVKIILEHIIFDYHIKKDIIEEIEPNEEFYILLDKWIITIENILDNINIEMKG